MAVALVTDSSACLDPAEVERRGIDVAPLHVLRDGRDYREGVDVMPEDLAGATTAGASPAELRGVYGHALERSEGDGVVAVHISRPLSGTWEAARNAAKDFGGRVRIVDSRSTAMGLGFAVLAAADESARGADLDAVYEVAVDSAARSRCFIVVDSLENLRRGGRIGTAAALLGTALSIKPVLHLHEGRLVVREKTRTATKARTKMLDAAVDAAGDPDPAARTRSRPVDLAVHHFRSPDVAESVAQRLGTMIETADGVRVTEFDAVLGVHVGPGAIGVVVSPRVQEREETEGFSTGSH